MSSLEECHEPKKALMLKRRQYHTRQLVEEYSILDRRRTKAVTVALAAAFVPLLLLYTSIEYWDNQYGSMYGGTFWLFLSTAVVGSAATVESTEESTTTSQHQHRNIVEQLWHKFQQVTAPKKPFSLEKHVQRRQMNQVLQNDASRKTIDTITNKQAKDTVLSPSYQEWIQSLLTRQQQHQQEQQHTTAAKQQENPTSYTTSIAAASQNRRRALYQHSLQQHYSKLYLNNVQNPDTYSCSSNKRSCNATLYHQQQLRYNVTLWDNVRHAFYTYTHSRHHGMIHREAPLRPSASYEKIDRTTSLHTALPPFPPSRIRSNVQLVHAMFQHGYDSYMYNAYPAGEIHPISCQPGTFDLVRIPALTVFDSLDTLLVMGNITEFARAVERIRHLHVAARPQSIFAIDQNVSVFETNIRVLGGLLSAHQLALALQLDQPTNVRRATRTTSHSTTRRTTTRLVRRRENEIVLRFDVLDAAGEVKWGPLQHESDVVERWLQYRHGQYDTVDTSTVCAAFDSTSFVDGLTDAAFLSVLAPCDSTSLSLQDCAVLSKSSCCPTLAHASCKNQNTTAMSAAIPATDYWTYDGFLLELALDIGTRLLPAFSTPTGIPYGTVNLLYGVPTGETTVASLAGGGTLTLEFELLSRLTGDTRFGKAAKLASRALFRHRSNLDLFGKHIDIQSGAWVETLSGIGSNSDSFLEYLAKHYMLFPEDDDFWVMFKTAYAGVFNETRLGEWYADVDMNHGVSSGSGRRVFESLAAFYPGLQVLLGESTPAARSLNSFFMVREILGFLPERFNYGIWNLDNGRDGAGIHPLRPELLESCYFMHRATKGINTRLSSHKKSNFAGNGSNIVDDYASSGWQWAADYALHKLESATHVRCGYSGLRELKPQTTGSVNGTNAGMKYMNEMPSFFLSETLKYLLLIFDDDNILHRDNERQWIFTTEAHPVHYVPPKSASAPSSVIREFTRDIASIKSSLRRRLQGGDSPENSARSNYDDLFFKGKWTKTVDNRSYRDDIQNIVSREALRRKGISANGITGNLTFIDVAAANPMSPFVPPGPFLLDSFGESRSSSNVAHLTYGNWGSGVYLRKECHNIYSSDLLWMQALNGGATDYSDTYVSSGYDAVIEDPHFFTMFGAADALGALGIGIYVGEKDLEGSLCPISATVDEIAPGNVEEVVVDNTKPILISSDIGNFEVSTYPNGAGFHVRHVESGEVVTANLVTDENPTGGQMAIVHSELRTSKWITMPKETTSTDGDNDQGMTLIREKQRHTSVLDFEGHSFSCEVKLLRKTKTSFEEGNEQEDEVVSTIPCSPAMFGPSHIEMLKEHGSVVVESALVGPREDNLLGCNVPPLPLQNAISDSLFPLNDASIDSFGTGIDSQYCDANSIHLVYRGDCTFFSKAVNMNKMWNIDALIVINTSEEMFMMSSGADEIENVDPSEVPLSVLISEQDGVAFLDLLGNETNAEFPSSFFARVAVEQQSHNFYDNGEIMHGNDPISWPMIRGNNNVLQVLVEFGWGIYAVINTQDEQQMFQISILRHSFDSEA